MSEVQAAGEKAPLTDGARPLPPKAAAGENPDPSALSQGDAFKITAAKTDQAPIPAQGEGIDWGRVGIAAGMAPAAYLTGVALHEGVGHGVVVEALGGDVTEVNLLPSPYRHPDGTMGIRFGSISYLPGEHWTDSHQLAVSMGPAVLDTAMLTTGAVLYETGNWPENPWASGALFAVQTAAAVDLGVNATSALMRPNGGSDVVKAANGMGLDPRALGGLELGLAIASGANLARIGWNVFGKKAEHGKAEDASAPKLGIGVGVSPAPALQLHGTF